MIHVYTFMINGGMAPKVDGLRFCDRNGPFYAFIDLSYMGLVIPLTYDYVNISYEK